MTVAALVAGNTVILKPAEQSPVIALAARQRIFTRSRPAPWRASSYLPGTGEESPARPWSTTLDVDLIAFTGSRDVGLLDQPPGRR